MTPFQEEIVKIVLDKALFGIIGGILGYKFAGLLEDRRARNTHIQAILAQRIEAARTLAVAIGRNNDDLLDLFDALRPEGVTREHRERLFAAYLKRKRLVPEQTAAALPFVTPSVAYALSRYTQMAGRLERYAAGETDYCKINRPELVEAYADFLGACQRAIVDIPFDRKGARDFGK